MHIPLINSEEQKKDLQIHLVGDESDVRAALATIAKTFDYLWTTESVVKNDETRYTATLILRKK